MALSAEHVAIKTAFEESGMTPQEISEDRQLDVIAVKSALMQCSSIYRRACGMESPEEDELNFSNEQLKEVNEIILTAARCADHPDGSIDWKTRLNAAVYVRDDKKGRKEAMRAVQNNQTNIFQINQQIAQARGVAESYRNRLVPNNT